MKSNFIYRFKEFLESEKASGIILILCTIASMLLANSSWAKIYLHFWHRVVLGFTLQHWINDGLMAIFFLLIGLEIERELYEGELSDLRRALLPVAAALGGMATPALFHFLVNRGTKTVGGAGIPMATDIAFALGVIALLGPRVPVSLKVFVAALSIIDDLGAIVVIALFYVADFSILYFVSALSVFAALLVLNRSGTNRVCVYLILGLLMWYLMLRSGVHATIAGVLLAFAIPFRRIGETSPSWKVQHFLHKPVAFVIMPLFAIANTGIPFTGTWAERLTTSNSLGIIAGLVIGKPIGISLFSYVAVKFRLAQLPDGVRWKDIIGCGFLGGIGFTMSIFITLLAFEEPEAVQASKLSIVLASLVAGTVGYLILRMRTIGKIVDDGGSSSSLDR